MRSDYPTFKLSNNKHYTSLRRMTTANVHRRSELHSWWIQFWRMPRLFPQRQIDRPFQGKRTNNERQNRHHSPTVWAFILCNVLSSLLLLIIVYHGYTRKVNRQTEWGNVGREALHQRDVGKTNTSAVRWTLACWHSIEMGFAIQIPIGRGRCQGIVAMW